MTQERLLSRLSESRLPDASAQAPPLHRQREEARSGTSPDLRTTHAYRHNEAASRSLVRGIRLVTGIDPVVGSPLGRRMVNPFNISSVYMAGIVWVLMLLYWICACYYAFVAFNLFV
jgi:hypothetical protein